MRVDVDGLIVQVAQTCEGFAEGIGGWSVSRVDVMIVLLPMGQIVPENGQGIFDLLFNLMDCLCDDFGG